MTGGLSNFGSTTGFDFSGGSTKLPLAAADGAGFGLEAGVADGAALGVDAATASGGTGVCALTLIAQATTTSKQTHNGAIFIRTDLLRLCLCSRVIRNAN